jgi:hypothetical protein
MGTINTNGDILTTKAHQILFLRYCCNFMGEAVLVCLAQALQRPRRFLQQPNTLTDAETQRRSCSCGSEPSTSGSGYPSISVHSLDEWDYEGNVQASFPSSAPLNGMSQGFGELWSKTKQPEVDLLANGGLWCGLNEVSQVQ